MFPTSQQERPPLPRRVRRSVPAATGPGDLSELDRAVRALLRLRPDLARPVPTLWSTPPPPMLSTNLLIALDQVRRLALSIDADQEAAEIARLINTLRTTV
ncbi:hypothetical protein [Nocardiopsis sp. CNT312]|uniref:hypothetical protein n=1 Tax=Nocardiopsis sp. CNT312 TaxID=1137268 RepID=UPI00048DFDB8|nr:hypothetical protein [Nocardiopsis sp. CNT312]